MRARGGDTRGVVDAGSLGQTSATFETADAATDVAELVIAGGQVR